MESPDLRQVLLFLSRVEPTSSLRLMLQLALASHVPEDTLERLEQRVREGASLVDLLERDRLLTTLLDADGKIDTPEENMLYDAVEQIGLALPANRSGAEVLLQDLTGRIVREIGGSPS